MKPVTQSRTGNNGTCFRACLASVLDLKENDVPDFPDANQDPGVNHFLAKHGLRYDEVSAHDPDTPPPVGLHIMLGTSPRGGDHAVVGRDGKLIHDPHPQDGTGRGLVEVSHWGLLLPLAKRAKDADDVEYVLRGTPAGSSDRFDERVLYTQGKTSQQLDAVKARAAKDGWHSFRVQKLNLREKPNFTSSKLRAKDSVTLRPDKDGCEVLEYTEGKDVEKPKWDGPTGRFVQPGEKKCHLCHGYGSVQFGQGPGSVSRCPNCAGSGMVMKLGGKAVAQTSDRAALHRALDCVLDSRAKARDAVDSLKPGDRVECQTDHPGESGVVTRMASDGGAIIEWTAPRSKELRYGSANSESWPKRDWRLLRKV